MNTKFSSENLKTPFGQAQMGNTIKTDQKETRWESQNWICTLGQGLVMSSYIHGNKRWVPHDEEILAG